MITPDAFLDTGLCFSGGGFEVLCYLTKSSGDSLLCRSEVVEMHVCAHVVSLTRYW